jgi:AcrR family transcriptional regulator
VRRAKKSDDASPHPADRSSSRNRPAKQEATGKWIRFTPDQRRQMILSEALKFFAEHGFEADTRTLAKQIGISQPLIYRYFRTKDALIDSVYERIYRSRWRPEWKHGLMDRRIDLNLRLKRFYKSYLSTFDEYEWIRISVFSGLKGNNLVRRYFRSVVERVIGLIAQELRYECDLEVSSNYQSADLDLELAWNFHAAVIYLLMRRYVFNLTTNTNNDALVDQAVDQLLPGTLKLLKERNQKPFLVVTPQRPRDSGERHQKAPRRAAKEKSEI